MGAGLFSRLTAFAKQPFNPQGDAVTWALFVVFAITVAVAWKMVLGHIIGSVREEL